MAGPDLPAGDAGVDGTDDAVVGAAEEGVAARDPPNAGDAAADACGAGGGVLSR